MTILELPARIPPHNLDAERAALGIVLLEGAGVLPKVCEVLQVSDLYTEAHRTIFSTLLTMAAAGQSVDMITLAEELRKAGALETVGGVPTLALLEESAAVRTNLPAYLAIIRNMAILRELIHSSTQVITRAFDARDDVQGVVDQAREVFEQIAQRAVIAEQPFPAMLVKALIGLDIPDPVFLVQDWIPAESISFVVGDSEAFKSWFTLYLAFCIAAGEPLFGRFPTRQVPVLVISEENGLAEDRRRASAIARGMGFNVDQLPLHIAADTSFSFDEPAKYAAMRAYVDEHGIKGVIIDSFVRVHRREEKDAGQMNALYLDRVKPLVRAGVAIIALHHKRKLPAGVHAAPSDNDDIRGSGDIRAAAHAVLFLRPASDSKVVVKHNKARGWKKQEPYVFGLKDSDQGGVVMTYEGKPEDALDRTEACKVAILDFAQQRGTVLRKEIETALKGKFSKKVFDPVLKELCKNDYPLRKDKIGRDVAYHFVSGEADPPEPGDNEDVPF